MIDPLFRTISQNIPGRIKNAVKLSPLFVRHRSRLDNIYHCTVYRTGSQWIRRIFSDRRTTKYSGMLHEFHPWRTFGDSLSADQTVSYDRFPYERPFKTKRVITIYTGYEPFLRIPKPETFRTFFVIRDPRDIVVSQYFAALRDAEINNPDLFSRIKDSEQGLLFVINLLEEMGLFVSIRSWLQPEAGGEETLLLRFEDLISDQQFEGFRKLFEFCDIRIPDTLLARILKDNSFQVLSEGRKRGDEDRNSHYRKGISGDWKRHFSPSHIQFFRKITGDLITTAGYEW